MKKFNPPWMVRIAWMLFLCVAAFVPRGAVAQSTNYALAFNGTSYVSLSLTNPPATNYTISAWVYLNQGGSYNLPIGILSAQTCGGSIEFMIHSSTANNTDPQYFELGACGHFDGQLSPCPVPLNTWTHIAVTLGSNNLVSFYVNGALTGSFIDPSSGGYYMLGTAVALAGNGSGRRFNGMLDEVQIWNRALSAAEVQADHVSLSGSESGLYAYYRFNDGSGSTATNSAVASGASNGALVNNPGWLTPGAPLLNIQYAGVQQDLGSGWRTPSVSKPLDIDGDNILGSDGYYLVNLPPVLPAYISQATILTSTSPGDPNYASVDDPTHPGSLFGTGTMNPFPGSGSSADLFSFEISTNAVPNILRVGLMVDNLDDAGYNAASLELLLANGAGAVTGQVATISSSFNDRTPDWVFFDIQGPESGDVFLVRGTGGPYGAATLGGVAFDSASPVVTTTNDSGPGSLRKAVYAGGVITLAGNLAGQTIVFTNGAILLQTNVTIDASAMPGGLTLSGYNGGGIFSVGGGATVSLTGLTMTNGNQYDGGAVYGAAASSVTVTRCTLSGNSAVEGGALVNDGAMTLIECTLAGNSASYGGAMECRGTTTISQCTISGNSGFYGGGGLWIGNAMVTVSNSIIAGNSAPQGSGLNTDVEIAAGALTYSSSNLVQFVGGSGTPTGPAPLTSAPMLSPLGNYGGPMQTMPPLPGSPAIDAGGPTTLTTDQRGFPRIVGPAPDLGAAEFLYAGTNVVTTAADGGLGSLRHLLAYSISAVTVTFDASLSGKTILLTNGQIELPINCTIDASSLPGGITLNGNHSNRIFQVDSTVVLNSLTITNGIDNGGGNGGGGGIRNIGTLTLNECTLAGNLANQADAGGGGILNFEGLVTVNQCTLAGNSATGAYEGTWGGAINNDQGTVVVLQSTISSNTGAPGGIINRAGTLRVINSIVAGNNGGDIDIYSGGFDQAQNLTSGDPLLGALAYNGGPTPTMMPLAGSPAIDACTTGTSFILDQRGFPRIVGPASDIGAVEYEASPIVTTNADSGVGSLRDATTYATNNATITFAPNLSGQTILLTNGEITLIGAPVQYSTGQIESYGHLTIDASALPGGLQINGNQASRIFYINPFGSITLNSLTLTNGNSTLGGAIYNDSSASLTMANCSLVGNSAPNGMGGAIYNAPNDDGGNVTLNQCTLAGNSAPGGQGGAIFIGDIQFSGGDLALDQCTLSGNSATSGQGGAIFIQDSSDTPTTLFNCIVAGNTPDNFSGSFTGAPNLTNGNPHLAALASYGGPTQTMPPLPGSPVIDAGAAADFTTDQRGFPRVLGPAPDLGAVEGVFNPAGPGPLTAVSELENGAFQFGFTNYSGMTQTILATTNLALPISLWLNLGPAVESAVGSGIFQFTDPQAPNYSQRFYRVRSP
ncbi:MAG TPA: choice-of-anchor Q domain-containing protein [Verrucomicrobiae bacterium]|nr:choice-of-anchor Q domain-containing protein [Verrucomicrobiae bacterium]